MKTIRDYIETIPREIDIGEIDIEFEVEIDIYAGRQFIECYEYPFYKNGNVYEKYRSYMDDEDITNETIEKINEIRNIPLTDVDIDFYYDDEEKTIRVGIYFETKEKLQNIGKGYVYFIKNKTNNFIKIGKTNNVKQRFNTLNKMNANQLKLIGYIEYRDGEEAYENEAYFHHEYDIKRIKGTEWFEIDEESIRKIKGLIEV